MQRAELAERPMPQCEYDNRRRKMIEVGVKAVETVATISVIAR